METNQLFKRCKPEEKEEMLANFEEVHYASAETIIKAGDAGDCFYVIAEGTCDIYLPGTDSPVARCQAGNAFGELALMSAPASRLRAFRPTSAAVGRRAGTGRGGRPRP